MLGGRTDIKAPVDVLVSGSVFESGGRAVRRSLTRTMWPAEVLVGVRPLFDLDEGADYGSTAGFEIVRIQAKSEAPLAALARNFVSISTIAEVTFYGRDQTGREVSVTGNISVNFANFGDPN